MVANRAIKDTHHLSLHPVTVPHYLRVAQDASGTKRGSNLQYRNDNSFLFPHVVCCLPVQPLSSLHTDLIHVGERQLGEKADVAADI